MTGLNPQTTNEALADVVKGSLIAGGGAALASAIIHQIKKNRDEEKNRKLFQSFVESDSPVVRVDPSIQDTATEEALSMMGSDIPEQMSKVSDFNQADIEAAKEPPAYDPGETIHKLTIGPRYAITGIGALARAGASQVPGVSDFATWASDPQKKEWFVPAAIAAALASAYGGYKGMDWLMDKIEGEDAEADFMRKRNLYQSKVNEALQRRYGDPEKTASLISDAMAAVGMPFSGLSLPSDVVEQIEKEAQAEKEQVKEQKTEGERFLGALTILAMLGMGGLSYTLSKRYFDKNSEARQRYKQLEREIRQRNLNYDAPTLVDADFGFLDKIEGVPMPEKPRKKKAEAVRMVADKQPVPELTEGSIPPAGFSEGLESPVVQPVMV